MAGFNTADALSNITGVEEVHKIAGDDCFLIKLRVKGTDELADVLDNEINKIKTVSKVKTTIVLKTVMENPTIIKCAIIYVAVNWDQR